MKAVGHLFLSAITQIATIGSSASPISEFRCNIFKNKSFKEIAGTEFYHT